MSRAGPSQFLEEVRGACADGAGEIDVWHPEPDPDEVNPALAEPATAQWPAAAAAGARYQAVREAGDLVQAALRAADATGRSVPDADPDDERISAWIRDTDLLLTERARRRASSLVKRMLANFEVPYTRMPAYARVDCRSSKGIPWRACTWAVDATFTMRAGADSTRRGSSWVVKRNGPR